MVVCTIHQPSSSVFARLDKLYLLSQGKPVYFGPTAQLVDYFQSQGLVVPNHVNPADFALETINTDFGAKIEDIEKLSAAFRSNVLAAAVQAEYAPATAPSRSPALCFAGVCVPASASPLLTLVGVLCWCAVSLMREKAKKTEIKAGDFQNK